MEEYERFAEYEIRRRTAKKKKDNEIILTQKNIFSSSNMASPRVWQILIDFDNNNGWRHQ